MEQKWNQLTQSLLFYLGFYVAIHKSEEVNSILRDITFQDEHKILQEANK